MSLLINFQLTFTFVTTIFCSASQAKKMSSGLFLLKKSGYRLNNGFLRSVSVASQMTCASHCALEKSSCKSFNYIADSTIEENCELNSNVALNSNDGNLVASVGAKYYEKIEEDEDLPSTCTVLKYNNPQTPSGYYTIQPNKHKAPFKVFCNMKDKNEIGVTVFGHDSEEKTHVNGYEDEGSYKKVITYKNVTVDQIETVVNLSRFCEQFIKYDCKSSGFFFRSTSGPASWWVSRQGYKMVYWGGARPGSKSCACGMTSSCLDKMRACNCNSVSGVWVEDSGFLVDKEYLPVSELRFGDTGHSLEEGYHTLGKLSCWN